MQKKISYKLLLLLTVPLLFACDRDRNHKGYAYYPDMKDSRAFETYSENLNFTDGKTLRLPVEGTVPRSIMPYRLEKTLENRAWAGRNLKSPFKMKMKHVNEGKKLYKIYCYNCHGLKGNGKGFLVTSGKYPYPAANLLSDKMRKAPRGEIVHVITVGFGVMGAHGPQISQEDRWKIAEYVKVKLQGMKLGEEVVVEEETGPKESYEAFEARLAKIYPRTKGIGPVISVSLGPINQEMAEEGARIYKRMCTSCHKPTKRYIGPAPKGILERRSPEWIMNMILNPVEMVEKDPVAKELLGRFLSPMADQNLTEEEARKVLEYFRTIK